MAVAEEIRTMALAQQEAQNATSPRALTPAQSPSNFNSKEQIFQKQTLTAYKPKGSPSLTKFDIDEHTVMRTFNELSEHEPENSIVRRRRSLGLGVVRPPRLSIAPTPDKTQNCKLAPLPPLAPSVSTPSPLPFGALPAPSVANDSPHSSATSRCNVAPEKRSSLIPQDLLAERSPSTLRTGRLLGSRPSTNPNYFLLVKPSRNSIE